MLVRVRVAVTVLLGLLAFLGFYYITHSWKSREFSIVHKTFHLVLKEKVTWENALAVCQSQFPRGSLACIMDKTEQETVDEVLKNNNDIAFFDTLWIGGRRSVEGWAWVDSGRAMNYSSWAADDASADCAQLTRHATDDTYRWTATRCDSANYYLCQSF